MIKTVWTTSVISAHPCTALYSMATRQSTATVHNGELKVGSRVQNAASPTVAVHHGELMVGSRVQNAALPMVTVHHGELKVRPRVQNAASPTVTVRRRAVELHFQNALQLMAIVYNLWQA